MLLGGVPGVAPGKVMVIGGGTAGLNAARVATGIGADVTIVEVDLERMRFLDITMHEAHTLYSTEANISTCCPRIDLIIGAVLIPGSSAPKVITREMLSHMQPGSVFVDIAIDQGGCAETSRPTTHEEPTYVEEEVLHYCVANMPGAYARTATQALNNATHRWTHLLAENGVAGACRSNPDLLGGINCIGGQLTSGPSPRARGWTVGTPRRSWEWPEALPVAHPTRGSGSTGTFWLCARNRTEGRIMTVAISIRAAPMRPITSGPWPRTRGKATNGRQHPPRRRSGRCARSCIRPRAAAGELGDPQAPGHVAAGPGHAVEARCRHSRAHIPCRRSRTGSRPRRAR